VSQHKSESCCFLKSASVSHAVTLFIDISSVVVSRQPSVIVDVGRQFLLCSFFCKVNTFLALTTEATAAADGEQQEY
jgi:hypothetical protein